MYTITLENTNDPSLSENEMSQIRYTMEIDEEHMVEKNGSGKIVSAGSEVDPVFKALIEQGPEDLEDVYKRQGRYWE